MEFKPRHPQPFDLQTAIQLSIPEITNEIARLQLSIQHLQSTQSELETFLSGVEAPDQDLADAFDENKATIASQEERIRMLRFALERKGASSASNPHYDLSPQALPPQSSLRQHGDTADLLERVPDSAPEIISEAPDSDEGGLFL